MAIYTLSISYIDRVREPAQQCHLLGVFYQFANPNFTHRVAMDKKKVLLNHYEKLSRSNPYLYGWLDLMTRNGSLFEVVEVDIPEGVSEEEMYLLLASATRPVPAMIVGSHQDWKYHCYLPGCSTICYNGTDVKVLDKDEAYRELTAPEPASVQNITHINNSPMEKKNNPWTSGSFYLFAGLVVLASLVLAGIYVGLIALPVIALVWLILYGSIGAFQLRNDEKLSQKSFLELMVLSFKLAVVRVRDGGKKE